MRAGDQLRQPGGPAGEQEHRDVPGAGLAGVPARAVFGGVRGLGAQRGQVDVAGVLAGHQDVAQGGRADLELFGHGLVVEVSQYAGHGDGAGLAVLAQVGQLVLAVRGQGHHRHDPGAQAAQGEHGERPAVRQLDHDPVAALEPEFAGEPAGQRVGPGHQGRVADPGRAVDQGRRFFPGVGDGRDLGPEGLPAPPAGLLVLPGQVLGPGHGPVSDHQTPPSAEARPFRAGRSAYGVSP